MLSSLQGETRSKRQLLLAWLLVLSSEGVWCLVLRVVVLTKFKCFIHFGQAAFACRMIRETVHHT